MQVFSQVPKQHLKKIEDLRLLNIILYLAQLV